MQSDSGQTSGGSGFTPFDRRAALHEAVAYDARGLGRLAVAELMPALRVAHSLPRPALTRDVFDTSPTKETAYPDPGPTAAPPNLTSNWWLKICKFGLVLWFCWLMEMEVHVCSPSLF